MVESLNYEILLFGIAIFAIAPSSTLVSSAFADSQSVSYLHTDKPYYEVPLFGYALVKIHGNIADVENGGVSVTINTPFNVHTTVMTHTDSTGSFFVTYVIKFDAPAGIYVVTANYENKEITTTFLVVRM